MDLYIEDTTIATIGLIGYQPIHTFHVWMLTPYYNYKPILHQQITVLKNYGKSPNKPYPLVNIQKAIEHSHS